jgi:large-conductance mechanosensitive channel
MTAHEKPQSFDHREPPSLKSFGVTFAVVFALIGLFPLIFGGSIRIWALAISAAFLAVTYFAPAALAPFNKLWFKFGMLLHEIVSPIILGLMFFVAVTPIALLMRLFGKRPLAMAADPKKDSYWIKRDPPGPDPKSLSNQF